MSRRSCHASGSPSGRSAESTMTSSGASAAAASSHSARCAVVEVAVEVRGVHALVAARRRVHGVALHERGVRQPPGRDVEHRRALVEPRDLSRQVCGEEPGPAGDVERPGRRQGLQGRAQRRDVVVPAGAVALGEQARPLPPVVVLRRALLVVAAHRGVHQRVITCCERSSRDTCASARPSARHHLLRALLARYVRIAASISASSLAASAPRAIRAHRRVHQSVITCCERSAARCLRMKSITAEVTAAIGMARNAPATPASTPPAVSASRIATGCSISRLPTTSG